MALPDPLSPVPVPIQVHAMTKYDELSPLSPLTSLLQHTDSLGLSASVISVYVPALARIFSGCPTGIQMAVAATEGFRPLPHRHRYWPALLRDHWIVP